MVTHSLVSSLTRQKLGIRGDHRTIYLNSRWSNADRYYAYDLISHYGCVNAVEFSFDGNWVVSGGDDRRVLLWNLQEALEGRGHKRCMQAEHRSNIFCLDTDQQLTKIYSGGNDEQVIVHDSQTGQLVDCFQHEEPVYSLSVHPTQADLFTTACSDGRLLLFDLRQPPTSEALRIAGFSHAFHSVHFNPVEHRLLVGANQKFGIGLYDIRKPKSTVLNYFSKSSMHARFNNKGTKIIGLRRRLPPVLFDIENPVHVCEFDHPQYYNSCTMKSCCFGGPDDNFVFSGSDDFNLYVWKVPEDEQTYWVDRAHVVLKGHRSIVNQVRYNPHNQLVASSGVEKVIKLWSDWPFPASGDGDDDKTRKVYTHEDYIGLVLRSNAVLHMDTLVKSTVENPRMMAFFDSLVQREIEGWESDDEIENLSPVHTSSGSEEEMSGFSHRHIGRRSQVIMERISVSIADDVMREERAIAEAQNTVGESILNSSLDSANSSAGQHESEANNTNREESDIAMPSTSSSATASVDNTKETNEAKPDNRIAELISRKRGQLIRLARKKGKRMREKPDSVISKSISHARKVLRISEPEVRFPSSDESCDESNWKHEQSPGSSSAFECSLSRLESDSSSSSQQSLHSEASSSGVMDRMASSPPHSPTPVPSHTSSLTDGDDNTSPCSSTPVPSSPSSSCFGLQSSDNIKSPDMTGVTQSRASLTTASSDHLPTQRDDDNEYLPDNLNVDITALLPSQVPDQTSRIKLKELRKKRMKIDKEDK